MISLLTGRFRMEQHFGALLAIGERRERVVVSLVWAAISGLVTYARTASFAVGQFRERDYLIVRNQSRRNEAVLMARKN